MLLAPSGNRVAVFHFAILTWLTHTPKFLMAASPHEEAHSSWHRKDFAVHGLEDIEPAFAEFDGDMYSGLLPMNNKNRHGQLMFWLFVPSPTTVSNPNALTIWLNGGPGCTSFGAGLFLENSPVTVPPRPAGYCCLQEKEPLQYNRYSWTNASALLYVEQPVGVGFSFGGPAPLNEDDLSGDMYAWLMNFFQVFEEYQDAELYIFGESYAGMYVPSMAHRIHQENRKLANTAAGSSNNNDGTVRRPVNLQGIALGNGWVDARVQGPATIDWAFWHGMIDAYTRDNLHAEWNRCQTTKPSAYHPVSPFHPFTVPDDCAMMEGVLRAAGAGVLRDKHGLDYPLAYGPNTYDATTWDPYGVILDGNTTFNLFFNDPRVKEILHAPLETEWAGCIPGAGRRRRLMPSSLPGQRHHRGLILEQDRPISTIPYMAELLDAGIRVLVYNGDRDLSTNAPGSEILLNSMEWKGMNEWKQASRALWMVQDRERHQKVVGGYAKELQGLAFVVVYNSGHMVPFNQPLPALDLITRFVLNETFMDYILPSFEVKQPPVVTVLESSVHSFQPVHPLMVFLSLLTAFGCGYWVSTCCKRKSDYQRIDGR